MIEGKKIKSNILQKISEAKKIIPKTQLSNLAIDPKIGVPAWHDFEMKIWKKGEEVRQQLLLQPKLRADLDIQQAILDISLSKKAKRGRQPFILLLGYKTSNHFAEKLVTQLNDEAVTGQIIITLYKMGIFNFKKDIEPYTKSKYAWIRNYAEKYISKTN